MSNGSYHSMSNRFPAFFTYHIYEKMSLFLFHILARDAFLPCTNHAPFLSLLLRILLNNSEHDLHRHIHALCRDMLKWAVECISAGAKILNIIQNLF